MRGIDSIGWRSLRRRKVRYALTALGIVLGVANVFGVFVANDTTNKGFRDRATAQFGKADVVAYPKERDVGSEVAEPGERKPGLPGISDDDIERLRRTEDVRGVAPWTELGAEAMDRYWKATESATGDRALREGELPPFPAPPNGFDSWAARIEWPLEEGRYYRPGAPEVAVSRLAADNLELEVGDHVTYPVAHDRTRTLRVVGIHASAPGTFGVSTSRETLRDVFGDVFVLGANIYLDGSAPDLWVVEHGRDFADLELNFSGVPTELRQFFDVIQGSLSGAATIALMVGAFLIYLTFTMSVVERTRLYGTLHAVGATGGQVRRAVLVEAATLGVLATAVGLAVGLGMAMGLVRLMGRVLETGPPPLFVSPGALLSGIGVGILATLAGALTPAQRAARISPVEAIRGSLETRARPSRAWVIGVLAVAAALLVQRSNQRDPDTQTDALTLAPTLLLVVGAVLLVPPLLPLIARAGRGVARRLSPRLGDVAVMHMTRERTRSAYTLALVMVVLAMIMTLGTARESVGRLMERWVETRFGADLFIYRENFPEEAERKVRGNEHVRTVTSMAFSRVRVVDPAAARVQNLVVVEPDGFFEVSGFPWADGDDTSAKAALERGGGVIVPATTARRFGLERGDEMTISTRSGPRTFRIAATHASIAAGNEVGIVIGQGDAEKYFPAQRANVLYVDYERGASAEAARESIIRSLVGARLSERRVSFGNRNDVGFGVGGYWFATGLEYKAQAQSVLRSYFGMFLAVLLVGVVVGLLGLANTMATSVVHRYREIGALQAIGAPPGDVSRMIVVEAGMLVLAAFVLSIGLGLVLGRMVLSGGVALLGFDLQFVYPWAWVPVLGLLAFAIAMVAAIAPARRAARLTPIEALRYE